MLFRAPYKIRLFGKMGHYQHSNLMFVDHIMTRVELCSHKSALFGTVKAMQQTHARASTFGNSCFPKRELGTFEYRDSIFESNRRDNTGTRSPLVSTRATVGSRFSKPEYPLRGYGNATSADDDVIEAKEGQTHIETPGNDEPSTAGVAQVDTHQGKQTGAFQSFPMVSPSYELIESALRRSDRVGYNKKLKNEGARAKNRAARQLDTLMKELTGPLGKYEQGFIGPERLHPFERALLELSVGEQYYTSTVEGVKNLRKSVVGVAKGYAGRCSKAPSKKEALDLRDEGFANVESVYKRQAYVLDEMKEIAKSLRRLPVVDPSLPIVALVGAPNVGKSSLVQLLSSGLPEIQNYPFTTRSIKMGHFYVNGRRYQVTDTPGLLCRRDEDRNDMERLTLASLEYLPTSVLFVMDLTGECGTSLTHQWNIREELKAKFGDKGWIDVFSKADMLVKEFEKADEIVDPTAHQKLVDDETQRSELSAIDLARLIPGALRVSSLTGDGVDDLKECMLSMIASSSRKT